MSQTAAATSTAINGNAHNNNGPGLTNGSGITQRNPSSSIHTLPPAHVFTSDPSHTLMPAVSKYRAHNDIPNTPLAVSLISTVLGGIFTTALTLTILGYISPGVGNFWGTWARPQLGLYIASLAIFHLLEFWVTARWNSERLSVDAFLLNNGKQYHAAHIIGFTEYFVLSRFWPREDWWYVQVGWVYIALPLLLAAQFLRTLAMIHAADSFSHEVQRTTQKDKDHVLVTWGVYRFSRHPSYTGFFYWAIATQLMLGNPISTIGFAVVLGIFFSNRIIDEEFHLTRYYGKDYVDYRARVGTWLPWLLVDKRAR